MSEPNGRIHFHALLERAGFRIRGRRADCPHCRGTARLTVAISDTAYYCHRCGKKGGLRSLARDNGCALPPETPRHREARRLADEFAKWADAAERALLDRHHVLWKRCGRAVIALQHFPEMVEAWDSLAAYYHHEASLCGALDTLCFERTSRWLENPVVPESLFATWREGAHASA